MKTDEIKQMAEANMKINRIAKHYFIFLFTGKKKHLWEAEHYFYSRQFK